MARARPSGRKPVSRQELIRQMHDEALRELPPELAFPPNVLADPLFGDPAAQMRRTEALRAWCEERGLDPVELVRASARAKLRGRS